MQSTVFFFFQRKSEQNVLLKVIWGIGIGTGIDTSNVADLANLDLVSLVDIDMLGPNPNPEPEPDSIKNILCFVLCLFFGFFFFFGNFDLPFFL